jgi:hypothetical protein
MAEARRNESEFSFESLGADPVDLEGLEQLLEFGHVELVPSSQPVVVEGIATEGSGPVSSEMRLILD